MYRRVVVVLVDGLRPEIVASDTMPVLNALARSFTHAPAAVSVRPSITVAALGSLATGVRPETHGLVEPGLGLLPKLPGLLPLGDELHRVGQDVVAVLPEMGLVSRSLTAALTRAAGVGKLVAGGKTAASIVRTARQAIRELAHGLMFVYIADCDGAGHAHGWLSDPYRHAAGIVDEALRDLVPITERDLLIILSDHGGGGIDPRDHDAPHPANDRIPLVLAGPGTARQRRLAGPVSLLDVPPTILWALGAAIPGGYEGRVLREAFATPVAVALP
jgi:hypothetical protein